MKHSFEMITPEIAADMLTSNTRNRSVRPAYVNELAGAMLRGEWVSNGDAIRFDETGVLLDGQHRLHAIVASGVPMHALVVRGIPAAAMTTIDVGRKRTAGDYLRLQDVPNSAAIAALARLTIAWDRDRLSSSLNRGGPPGITTTQVAEFAINNIGSLKEGVAQGAKLKQRIHVPGTPAGLVWMLTSQIDREEAEEFFNRLGDGQALLEGDAIYSLRRLIFNRQARRWQFGAGELVALMIKTWNFHRKNAQLFNLLWKPAVEAMPEPL